MTWKTLLVKEKLADPSSSILSIKYRDLHDAGALPEREWIEFLLQEFGREVNTIGSKAQSSEISVLIVEAKATMEKLREQVQNVE